MNELRMKDAYASDNPPTKDQFDRYLHELNIWIAWQQDTKGICYTSSEE
jgi:hypothetical protein